MMVVALQEIVEIEFSLHAIYRKLWKAEGETWDKCVTTLLSRKSEGQRFANNVQGAVEKWFREAERKAYDGGMRKLVRNCENGNDLKRRLSPKGLLTGQSAPVVRNHTTVVFTAIIGSEYNCINDRWNTNKLTHEELLIFTTIFA